MNGSTLAERYAAVRRSLPSGVKLIAVSKTRSIEEIKALYELGHRAFGENYPQELREKQPLLPSDIEWHFIGHLQTNKVKYIAGFVHMVHAVDSERLLDELEKRAAAHDRTVGALLQVHIAAEETKHGFSPNEIRTAIQHWSPWRWPHIQLRGLMGMATFTEDKAQVQREFAQLATLFREIRDGFTVPPERFDTLSMGMSGDLEAAIAEGTTMVRIGTALFGERTA